MPLDSDKPWALPARPGESDAELAERRHLAYFRWQQDDTVEWFRRMGEPLPLAGSRVLELGCGHGALALAAAEAGAAQVVGIDLDAERIAFARRNAASLGWSSARGVSFRCVSLAEVAADGTFDVILSKDSFEHLDDLPGVMADILRLLRPGGLLAAGFGPLYYSPRGDHDRCGLGIPWLHAVLPERAVLAWLALRGRPVAGISALGLNQLTPAGFRALFLPGHWSRVDIRYNQGRRRLLAPMRRLARLPGLERYMVTSIYATARKAEPGDGGGAYPATPQM